MEMIQENYHSMNRNYSRNTPYPIPQLTEGNPGKIKLFPDLKIKLNLKVKKDPTSCKSLINDSHLYISTSNFGKAG